MKTRSVVLKCVCLFVGMCACAQSGSPDYKTQASKFAQNDFYSQVTVANDFIYMAELPDSLVQYKGIAFLLEEAALSEADKLNGVSWKGSVVVSVTGVKRSYDRSDTGWGTSPAYGWSDWRNCREEKIITYYFEFKKSQWHVIGERSWSWGDSLSKMWKNIVHIPLDQIPNDDKNLDLRKLYDSLAGAATKSAAVSSINGQAHQSETPAIVNPAIRTELMKNTVLESTGPRFFKTDSFRTHFVVSNINIAQAYEAIMARNRMLVQAGIIRDSSLNIFPEKIVWFSDKKGLGVNVFLKKVADDNSIDISMRISGIGATITPKEDQAIDETAAVYGVLEKTGGTIKYSTPAPQALSQTADPPVGVSPAQGFDYPVGLGGSIPEQITPERNNLFPNNPTEHPQRYAASPGAGWYNAQDAGSYYTDYSKAQGKWLWEGLHPGEDWNKGSGSEDVGETVRCVANGQVVFIGSASASGPSIAGYVMVIRHWRPNGDCVDSLYDHIAPDRNEGIANSKGGIGTESDFTYQVGSAVTKGCIIGVIGAVSSFPPHLHFEMRNKKIDVTGPLWPHSTGDAYYGPEVGTIGNRRPTIGQSDVAAAFRLMQADGIIDPSDFIDDHRS
ncbi:MAG: M23 family metallopeptidase [Kiritimatiellales bacterium]